MKKYVFSAITGFILGVFFSGLENSLFFIISPIIFSLIIFIFSRFSKKGEVRFLSLMLCIFFMFFSLGQIRFYIFNKNIKREISLYEDKKVEMRGFAFKESESDGEKQKVYLDISEIKSEDSFEKINGRVLVFTNLYPKIGYGDKVLVSGKITKPDIIKEEGRVFNYPKYLAKDKITHIVYFASLQKTGLNEGNFIKRNLISLKNIFISSVSKVLKEPELSLSSGIIFGSKSLSKDIENIFRISGLSHITVLSGYNITVVAENILKILLPITKYANFLSVFSVIIFITLSGVSSTSIRAGIMATIAILGRRFGKSYSVGRALLFALFLMVLWNPFILLYDPSFHLSFLATISIIYLSPIVYEKFIFITDKFSLRGVVSTTISAQVFVLPYIIYMTGKVSVYGLFSNILVLPFIPFSMFLGFWTGFLGLFSKYMGLIFGLPLNLILKYFIFIAEKTAKLPFSQVSSFNLNIFFMVLIYVIFGIFLWRKNR